MIPKSLLTALACILVLRFAHAPSRADDTGNRDEIEQIAEEALICGFPMVMGYGVLYEPAIDTKSDQY
jgi:hypothetical protein